MASRFDLERPSPRRGFLRGLLALPLVGGGVQLVGSPSAVAAPPSRVLLERYLAWIAREHAEVLIEMDFGPTSTRRGEQHLYQPLQWFPDDGPAIASVLSAKPSTRAALVLATVGCELP